MSATSHEGTSDRPVWDQDRADALIGQYALVGITYVAADGETVTSQVQFHGRIVSAKPDAGIRIACEGNWAGRTMGLPPHIEPFQPATPGKEYVLRSTREAVMPDLLATWSVFEEAKS